MAGGPGYHLAGSKEMVTIMERLTHLDKALETLAEAVDASPADFTEIAWIERRVCRATSSGRSLPPPRFERTVLVRVRERGRFGFHRLDGAHPTSFPDAIRQALGQARVHPVIPLKRPNEPRKLPSLPRDQIFDSALAKLEPEDAQELLCEALGRDEKVQLEWVEGRVAVLSSLGFRRHTRVTGATLFASSGRGPQAGVARGSSRSLERVSPRALLEHARSRRAQGLRESMAPEELDGPLVLAPEAATALLGEVGRLISASLGHAVAPALLRQCFASSAASPLSVYDDGADPSGMPFPFDLKGSAKRRLDLVKAGEVQPLPMGWVSPSDQTGWFSAGGGEVQLSNLFLAFGQADQQGLLERAGDGIWISALRRPVCHDPARLGFRALGRGLRRIQGGELVEALPDRPVTGSLAQLFGRVQEVGKDRLSQALGDGIFGGVTAPALLLGPAAEARSAAPVGEAP